MPYVLLVGSTYTISNTNFQAYTHETNWCNVVENTVKLKALEKRAGAALSSSQIAANYPDRPTETLVVKWEEIK